MKQLSVEKPLALRNLQQVDLNQSKLTPINQWNWKPAILDPDKINKLIASGDRLTTKNTFSSQLDHGENW